MEKNISKKIFENAQKFGSTISEFSDWTNPTPSNDVTFPRASLLFPLIARISIPYHLTSFDSVHFPVSVKRGMARPIRWRERESAAHERRQPGSALLERDFGWNRAKDYPSLASFLPGEELHNRNERSGPPSPFFQSFFNPSSLSQRSIFSDRSIFAGDK